MNENELQEFVKEVEKMRELQKRYFLTRYYSVLAESKKQEKKVDSLIAQYTGKTLF